MGANESSENDRSSSNREIQSAEVKTCYYELLGVDPKASEDE